MSNNNRIPTQAYIKIIEQPHPTARFRYQCENTGGVILGKSSTTKNRTFPEIEICGYQGDILLVVSCVTKDAPYLEHPHKLVGSNCKNGVCTVTVTAKNNMRFVLNKVKIQCVRKNDVLESLAERQRVRVDPFRNGFTDSRVINLNTSNFNSIRLCFQAFIRQQVDGTTVTTPLKPVVSDVIAAKNSLMVLTITELSACVGRVDGGEKILLFCEKVDKKDVKVLFFEEDDEGQRIWEAEGIFNSSNVHKQAGISFKTPPYRDQYIREPVKVYLQLFRPSDGSVGSPIPFEYIPITNPGMTQGKRKNFDIDESARTILEKVSEPERKRMNNIFEMYLFKENCDKNLNFNFDSSVNENYCDLYPTILNIPPAGHDSNNQNLNDLNPGPSGNSNKGQDWNLNVELSKPGTNWLNANENNKENHPPTTNQNLLVDLLDISSNMLINNVDVFDGLMDFH